MAMAPPKDRSLDALFIAKEVLRSDPALSQGGRGKRKIAVTRRFPQEPPLETPAFGPGEGGAWPVMETEDIEVSFFTEAAGQDLHWHRRATEVYIVHEGAVRIQVEDTIYRLAQGDTLVVLPGAVHEVLPSTAPFLCQVIAADVAVGDKERAPSPPGARSDDSAPP